MCVLCVCVVGVCVCVVGGWVCVCGCVCVCVYFVLFCFIPGATVTVYKSLAVPKFLYLCLSVSF